MYKLNESQISRLKGKTCVQNPLLPDESSCGASVQAILRLAQNMTESFLLLLERLLENAVLRRRAWPQWEMPRDCSRWKVAPKAQPVSMLFTFFESCWGGKKKSSHLHQFSALANMTQAESIYKDHPHGQTKVKFGVACLGRLPTTHSVTVSFLPWLTPANLISENSGPGRGLTQTFLKEASEFFPYPRTEYMRNWE